MRKNNRKRIISTVIVGAMLCAGAAFGTVKYINHDNGGNGNNGTSETTVIDKSSDIADAQQTVYMTDFQKENAQKEKKIVADKVEDKKDVLESDQGLYAPDSIVLSDTTKDEAERIAEKLGADVRLTDDGSFAVLYLPEGMTIDDVYNNDEYSQEITEMTPDYYVSVSELNEELGGVTNNISDNLQLSDETLTAETAENEDAPVGDDPQSTSKVISARPDYTANDPNFRNQQYLDYINLKNTWNTTKGRGVTVAVIDSGIDTDHPEFKGRISEKSYNASEDKIVKDYDISVIEDEQGHGTEVAGVLAASMDNNEGIAGVAPEVELLVIKCDVSENGEFVRGSDTVFGLAYAIEADVDIINMSFTSIRDIYSNYTSLAVDSDIICVAAAGNGSSNSPVYPASLDSVIGVGAYDFNSGEIADYSNYGENLDILAPGTAYTTSIGCSYKISTGTSMAAPVVAGAAALYKSACGRVEFDHMKQLFEASSVDLGIAGEDYYNGFGEVDVYALVCEEKGKITYDMLTDEVENQTQIFVKGHTVQTMPEPEREYLVFDGWYFDPNCEDVCELYTNVFSQDITLYAGWVNEDDGTAFTYVKNSDGTVRIKSYTGKRRYVTVPEEIDDLKVTEIGEYAFAYNKRARSIKLPSGIKNIRDGAFMSCQYLGSISIPDATMYIGMQAFYGCSRLTSIDISDESSLCSVGKAAFSFSGIQEFKITAKLTSLEKDVFYGSTALRKIYVSKDNPAYMIKNSALYNIQGTVLEYYPAGISGIYSVDDDTEQIAANAFAYSRSSEIVLNEGLYKIGKCAFMNSSIVRISFPVSLSFMGNNICYNCRMLSEVVLAEDGGLAEISRCAFGRTENLTNFHVPYYIKSIGVEAFKESGLKEISFDDNSQLSAIEHEAFVYTGIENITIPDSVLTIGSSAFAGDTELEKVYFGKNSQCKELMESAFERTINLKEFEIPDSVVKLGALAFYRGGLSDVKIGESLSDIGNGAFASCHSLSNIEVDEKNQNYASYEGVLYDKDKSILMLYPAAREGTYTLPDSTVEIQEYAFSGADKLVEVKMNGDLRKIGANAFEYCTKLQTPVLQASLNEIGDYAFIECVSMNTQMIIPKGVEKLGHYMFEGDMALSGISIEQGSVLVRIPQGAFRRCGIEAFTVPQNITTIGTGAFENCKNLRSVVFEAGSRIESIPGWLFSYSKSLKSVIFEAGSMLKNIEADAFYGMRALETVDFSGCTKLENIDNYAFAYCTDLSTVSLPDSLKEIGRYSFSYCSNIKQLTIPESVSRIGRYAFSDTNSILLYFESMTLPEELEENWDYGVGSYFMGVSQVYENDEWVYAVSKNGMASIIRYKGSSEEIEISDIDGYKVVSIGNNVFSQNKKLKKIVLPDTLTGIYRSAFAGTENLKEIDIPDSVTIIDTGAFSCSGIEHIGISENSKLVTIGKSAFEYTRRLKDIYIPEKVTEIREAVFYASGIQSIHMPQSLSGIGEWAFYQTKLEEVDIPSSVIEVGYNAFLDCKKLRKVKFEKSEKRVMLRNCAFKASGLTSVTIPESIYYIGETCFGDCQSLTNFSVETENQYYSSVDGVLYNKKLSKLIACPPAMTGKLSIPESVNIIAYGAFKGSKLTEVYIPENAGLSTIGYMTFYECKNLKQIALPDDVLSIEKYAFYGCSSLKKVELSANSKLTGVYDYAFQCSGLESFEMPSEMLEVGQYAFYGTDLKSITFNEKIKTIGDYAFADSQLTDMKSISVPRSVNSFGLYVFKNINSFEEITIPWPARDDEKYCNMQYIFGEKFVPDKLKKVAILTGDHLDDGAFDGYDSISEIYIPTTVKKIGDMAFRDCSSLQTVNIPDSVSAIGEYAFKSCSSIKRIHLSDMCIGIGKGTFTDCSSLENVYIGKTISAISDDAFVGCTKIEKIEVAEENNNFKSIDGILYDNPVTRIIIVPRNVKGAVSVADGVVTIGKYAFLNCGNIEKVYLPASVTMIDDYAFWGCSSLDEITLPQNLKKIGMYAFYGDGITALEMPDSLTEIGKSAFERNLKLKVIQMSNGLSVIPENSFNGCSSLESIVISGNITEIRESSFEGCVNLKYAYIGKNVQYIRSRALYNCDGLETIVVDDENPYFITESGVLYDKDVTQIIAVPRNISGRIKVPEGIQKIENSAFSNRTRITDIILPDTVVSIGDEAFYNCAELSNIDIGSGIKNIGVDALYNTAYSKKSTNYQNGILYVGNFAAGLDDDALLQMGEEIRFEEGTVGISDELFEDEKSLKKLFMPDSLKYIGDKAFRNCKNLKYVKWSKNLKRIGDDAFENTMISTLMIDTPEEINGDWISTIRYCKTGTQRLHLLSNRYVTTYIGAYSQGSFNDGCNADNVVIENEEQLENSEISGTGFNLFFGMDNIDGHLDSYVRPGRNVYFKGSWHMAEFYVDDFVIKLLPQADGDPLIVPTEEDIDDILPEGTVFIGWDIDGDGCADALPETSVMDIEAHAVYSSHITSLAMAGEVTVEEGETKTVAVTVIPKNNNSGDKLVWKSMDEDIAVVNDGNVSGVSEGQTTIKVSLEADENVYAECVVVVTKPNYGIKLTKSHVTINTGEKYKLTPKLHVPESNSADTVYESADTSIAEVSIDGVIRGISPGEVNITVRNGEYSAVCVVDVKQPITGLTLDTTRLDMNVGDSATLAAKVIPADTTDEERVFWFSKNTDVAIVTSEGIVSAVAPGTAIICGAIGKYRVTCKITVEAPLESISFDKNSDTLLLGREKKLSLIYTPVYTTDSRTAMWTSSNPEVASVDDNGLVTGLSAGKAVITATVGKHKADFEIEVTGIRDMKYGVVVANLTNPSFLSDATFNVSIVENADQDDEYGECVKTIKVDRDGRIYDLYLYKFDLINGVQTEGVDNIFEVDIPALNLYTTGEELIYQVNIGKNELKLMATDYSDGKYSFKTDDLAETYCIAVPTDNYQAAEIKVTSKKYKMCVGKAFQIRASVYPAEAVDKRITYISDNENVVKIDSEGYLTSVAEGCATITLKSAVEGVQTAIKIEVSEHKCKYWKVLKRPSCSRTGLERGVCEQCNKVIYADISRKEHNEVIDAAMEETCTRNGNTEGSHCSVCHKTLRKKTVIPKLGHVVVHDDAVAATCTTDGYKEGSHCSRCNAVLSGRKVIPAFGHNWDYGEMTKSPTYTSEGVMSYKCKTCGKIRNEKIPALEITDISKADCEVLWISDKLYNGKSQTQPDMGVIVNGMTLRLNTDYTVAYKNNKNIGTATLTITGKNGYTGTIKKTFAIKTQVGKVYGSTLKYKITNARTNGTGTVSLIGSGYSKTNKKFTALKVTDTVTIGGVKFKITKIENKAFMKYQYLTNVVVGSNVTGIGDYAFYGCPRLATVTVGKNIRTIGTKAFYGCKSLKTVKILSSKLVKTGTSAFAGIKANAAFALPKKYYNSYGRLIKKAGAPKKAVYKKF